MEAVYHQKPGVVVCPTYFCFGADSAIDPKAQWAYVRRVDGFQPGSMALSAFFFLFPEVDYEFV